MFVQKERYSKEIASLNKGKLLPRNSEIRKLDPIIADKLLRVGGRLKHSLLAFDNKHPVILPSDDHLTRLIAQDTHIRTLHAGVQLTLSIIRQSYWIVRGRQVVKSTIHACVTCTRYRGLTCEQKMGNLPQFRVRPTKAFLRTGIDYAGPYDIRTAPSRGHKSYKGYIALFVCMATRSVHLEVVSGYTTDQFLAAFRRFTSRRGYCSDLYSDVGTNFVGADSKLKQMYSRHSDYLKTLKFELSTHQVNWHFNPPAAPHFGGVWESAVRSVKFHLRRVIGEHTLTFEEFTTVLCEIEAVLNSRPITPLSDDPLDLRPITPAHLLIQSESFIVPDTDIEGEKLPPRDRWRLLQQMTQSFWSRWSQEYLQSLQQRNKWTGAGTLISVGDMVLLTHENTPPARWPLARVQEVHPGSDGIVRVATVRTATSVYKRPIVRLIKLPVSSTED